MFNDTPFPSVIGDIFPLTGDPHPDPGEFHPNAYVDIFEPDGSAPVRFLRLRIGIPFPDGTKGLGTVTLHIPFAGDPSDPAAHPTLKWLANQIESAQGAIDAASS